MLKRKVLFFHRTLRQSGAVRQLLNLFRGLDRERFDPFLVLERGDRVFDRSIFDSARVQVLMKTGDEGQARCLWRLLRILDRERPDLIQAVNPRSNRYFYLASLLRRLPPLYCSVRNTNQEPEHLRFEYFFQRRHRGLIVNSEGIRRHLIESASIAPSSIHLIPNGLDLEEFSPCDEGHRQQLRSALELEPDDFAILSVGRVSRQKNLLPTLEALHRMVSKRQARRILFLCVGSRRATRYWQELSSFLAMRGLEEHCRFVGPVSEIADFYRAADAMVLGSSWEGLPNALIENMACGGISVVSEAADNDAIVSDGNNGFKFPTGDSDRLAEQLETVLELDASRRRQIGERARKDAAERFSMERMIRAYQTLWEASDPQDERGST
jgi:glycosyltransferase involved in cell wall biosynthesis